MIGLIALFSLACFAVIDGHPWIALALFLFTCACFVFQRSTS